MYLNPFRRMNRINKNKPEEKIDGKIPEPITPLSSEGQKKFWDKNSRHGATGSFEKLKEDILRDTGDDLIEK